MGSLLEIQLLLLKSLISFKIGLLKKFRSCNLTKNYVKQSFKLEKTTFLDYELESFKSFNSSMSARNEETLFVIIRFVFESKVIKANRN